MIKGKNLLLLLVALALNSMILPEIFASSIYADSYGIVNVEHIESTDDLSLLDYDEVFVISILPSNFNFFKSLGLIYIIYKELSIDIMTPPPENRFSVSN